MSIGKTTQIMGPVVDVMFESGELPEIYSALEITLEDNSTLVCEVQQHLGENTIRSISMGPTEGLARGMDAKSTGKPIQAPVGREVLGRILVGCRWSGVKLAGEASRHHGLLCCKALGRR